MPIVIIGVIGAAALAYFFLYGAKPVTNTVQQGKTYYMNGSIPPDRPEMMAWTPEQWTAAWPSGWSSLQFVFLRGQGTVPPGLQKVLATTGWNPATGFVVKTTRTGAATTLSPGSYAQEV